MVFVPNFLYFHQLSHTFLDYLAFFAHAQTLQLVICEAQLLIHMRCIPPGRLQIYLPDLVVPVFFMRLLRCWQCVYFCEGRSLLQLLVREAPPVHKPICLAKATRLEIDGLCVVAAVANLPLHKQLMRPRHISQVDLLRVVAEWRVRAGGYVSLDILHASLGILEYILLPTSVEFVLCYAVYFKLSISHVSSFEIWAFSPLRQLPRICHHFRPVKKVNC